MHAELFNIGAVEAVSVTVAGAAGAFVRDIVNDGYLELPKLDNGKLFLGFMGGVIVGAFVGLILDGDVISAGLAGYTGSSLLGKLLDGRISTSRPLEVPKKDT